MMNILCDRPCFRALITQVIASSLQKALFWVLPQLASLSGTFGQQFSTEQYTGQWHRGLPCHLPLSGGKLKFSEDEGATASLSLSLFFSLSRGCWAPVWAAECPARLLSSARPQRDSCFNLCYVPTAWTQCGGHGAALGLCWVMLQHQKAPGASKSTADGKDGSKAHLSLHPRCTGQRRVLPQALAVFL